MRIVFQLALAGVAVVALSQNAHAQPGRGGRPPQPDSARVALDFQDQELRVVLDALAAAGELNVSLTNIPSQRVTLHMGRPVTREGMIDLVKGVAEQHGLKVTQTPTLIQISGPTPEPQGRGNPQTSLAQQLLAAQNQQQQVRLYTIRLKHASAVQLAPVLMNLFSGLTSTVGRGNAISLPFAAGGVNIGGVQAQVAPDVSVPGVAGGAAGGRGGGRGAAFGGAAGGGRGGNAPAAQLLNQLATSFQQAAGSLSGQAGEIRIIAEESSNSLLVRATEADFALIQQITQGVDLRPLQVLIEVTIAEVQRSHDLDVGVSGNTKRIPAGKTDADVIATAPSQASARDFILELVGGSGTIKYDVALAALQARGEVRVLSVPVIIAQNNRQAVINVGSRRPFIQVSQSSGLDPTGRIETVQYLDVGTVLTITPTINPDGYVNLQVQQEDNSASSEVQFDAPVINQRTAQTQVFIRDGQTTVIGGLAGKSRSRDVSGIPGLSRIPLLGPLLFGRTVRSDVTTELFLFLTPHIISSDEDIDKFRDAVKQGTELLHDVNVGPRIVPAADTIKVRIPPDSSTRRPDSLTTLRRRPPDSPQRDSITPRIDLAPVDSQRRKFR